MGKPEDKEEEEKKRQESFPLNETWPQDAQDELEEFIEQQGIYIRQ